MTKKISLIQVSGPDRTGKTTFLNKTLGFGSKVAHFPKPMLHKTPVGTIHSMSQVLEELHGFPAQRDWLNDFQVWDRGLIDPWVYDATRGGLFGEAQFKACYDASVQLLGDHASQVFLISTDSLPNPAKDEEDIYYRSKTLAPMIRDRYLTAAKLLRTWGAEVYVFRDFTVPEAAILVRDLFKNEHVNGLTHEINDDGTIKLGDF